ncbi:MAG TPA: hypothetical protein VFW69_06715 [Mycobacterium sp.]|nr:hypothetical protein [Mycobacterium sp.]
MSIILRDVTYSDLDASPPECTCWDDEQSGVFGDHGYTLGRGRQTNDSASQCFSHAVSAQADRRGT